MCGRLAVDRGSLRLARHVPLSTPDSTESSWTACGVTVAASARTWTSWPVVLWGTERSRRAWGKKDARDGHLLADSCLRQVAPADPDLPLDVVR